MTKKLAERAVMKLASKAGRRRDISARFARVMVHAIVILASSDFRAILFCLQGIAREVKGI